CPHRNKPLEKVPPPRTPPAGSPNEPNPCQGPASNTCRRAPHRRARPVTPCRPLRWYPCRRYTSRPAPKQSRPQKSRARQRATEAAREGPLASPNYLPSLSSPQRLLPLNRFDRDLNCLAKEWILFLIRLHFAQAL